MADSGFKNTVESLFSGMDSFLSTRTVVGDAITVGDVTLLPLVDVSFAIGAGAFHADKKDRGAGGLGGKMIPSAVLVIQNGTTKLVNIKNQELKYHQGHKTVNEPVDPEETWFYII